MPARWTRLAGIGLNRRMPGTAVQPGPSAPQRPDAFVSYSRRDKDYAESRLATALEARGKDVWIDVDVIRHGASDWRATAWEIHPVTSITVPP